MTIDAASNAELEEYSGGFTQQLSFDELDSLGGLEVVSHDLIDDGDKPFLLGVPHIITGLTFRPSDYNEDFDMLSLEAVVATLPKLEREAKAGRIVHLGGTTDLAALAPCIEPGGRIVYNDGSTGIRSQVVSMLHSVGAITVPEGDLPYRWTQSHTTWELNPDCVEQSFKRDGSSWCRIVSFPGGKPVVIKAPRGLRVSHYKFDEKLGYAVEGDTQRTYYLQ